MTKSQKKDMKNVNFLDSIGTIKNKQSLIRLLSRKAGIYVNQFSIEDVNSNALLDGNREYYDKTLTRLESDIPEAAILWINTGFTNKDTEEYLYICMTKNSDNQWEGGRVGTKNQFLKEFKDTSDNTDNISTKQEMLEASTSKPAENNNEEDNDCHLETDTTDDAAEDYTDFMDEQKEYKKKESAADNTEHPVHETEENYRNQNLSSSQEDEKAASQPDNRNYDIPLYHMESVYESSSLMNAESISDGISIRDDAEKVVDNQVIVMSQSWLTSVNGYNALRYYLESICCYAYQHQDTQDIIANDRDEYVINTGILDIFGQEVLICFHIKDKDNEPAVLDQFSAVDSKSFLLKKGFSENDIRKELRAVTVWEEEDLNRINHADYSDFDLADRSTLKLLLASKQQLLQAHNINISPYSLSKSIDESIQIALRINKRDNNYIKPGYDGLSGRIHYLIPLQINATIDCEANLILEVKYEDGLYRLCNILSMEEAYLKEKVISPYCTPLL